MRRDSTAQREPRADVDLSAFPGRGLTAGSTWFRAHRAEHGPWFFASGGGRFDLPSPRGTCYLAASPETAAREVVGPDLARSGRVPAPLVEGRVVSSLSLPQSARLARLTSSGALRFGVIGSELAAAVTYDLSQTWASAFASAGWAGLWYAPRFSGAHARAVALFGDAGAQDWPPDPAPTPLAEVVAGMLDLHVIRTPTQLSELTVLDEPEL